MDNLRLCSYNCRSLSTLKRDFVRTLLSSYDILFLQEHWLSDGQLPLLGDLDDNFKYTGVSGFGNREVLSGRPYGGCAILWRSSLTFNVKFLFVSSRRISAIKLSSDHYNLLLINVYMPFEDNDCNVNEFSDVLIDVECLLLEMLIVTILLVGI
jgi:exonuclease III